MSNRLSSLVALSPKIPNVGDQPSLVSTENFLAPKPLGVQVGSQRLANDSIFYLPDNQRQIVVLVLVSLHQFDKETFSCQLDEPKILSGYQNLLAFLYALQRANSDAMLLARSRLGAIILDDCSRDEKAVADLFDILSSSTMTRNHQNVTEDRRLHDKIQQRDIVGVLDLGSRPTDRNIRKFVRSLNLPLVSLNQVSMDKIPMGLGGLQKTSCQNVVFSLLK